MPDSSVFTLLALIISGALVVVLAPLAGPIKLVDIPDGELKGHGRVVPIVGGLAVFATVAAVMAGAGVFDFAFFWAALGVFLVGLIDDLRGLSPVVRLMASAAGGTALVFLGDFEAEIGVAIALVVLVVVGINAVNLLDGADGVAGSAAVISALGLAIVSANRVVDPVPALILAGAVAGFLVFNWPRARTFLGDGGAYVIGLTLAYLMIVGTPSPEGATGDWFWQVLVAVGLFGVFAIDLVVTFLRRMFARVPLFGGDRSHVYDQLAGRGWSPSAVAATVALSQVLVVGAIVYSEASFEPMIAGLATTGVLVLFVILLWVTGFVTGGGRHESARVDLTTPAVDSV